MHPLWAFFHRGEKRNRYHYHAFCIYCVARYGAELITVGYDQHEHDTELREDHPELYEPGKDDPAYPTDTDEGDLDDELAAAAVVVDRRYSTPMQHNNPSNVAQRFIRANASRSSCKSRSNDSVIKPRPWVRPGKVPTIASAARPITTHP